MLVEEQGLPLPNHAQHAVVHDEYNDRCLVGDCGSQFVQVHAEAAVAGDQNGLFAGCSCGTDRSTQTKAHGAKTAAGNKGAGCFKRIVLSHPHLMLSNVCGNDRFLVCRFCQCIDGSERCQFVRILCFQFSGLFL